MRKIFTLLFLTVAIIFCQAQKTNLSLNLEKGKEYSQITNAKTSISQDFDGQKSNMEMTINGKLIYKVLSVNTSDYDLEVWYKSLGMSIELPQGRMEVSSDRVDENNIFSIIMSKMIGNSINVKMSKNGKIIELNNFESLFDSIFEDFTDIPESHLEQIKAQMMQAYGPEAFKGNIEIVSSIFPENPVNIGDKWSIQTKLESGMSAFMTTEYELTALGPDYAMISGNSVIETEDKDAYIELNSMPLKYDLTGSMVSNIKIDKTSGWIIEADFNQVMEGDAFILENPQLPSGMKVPMTSRSETTITSK